MGGEGTLLENDSESEVETEVESNDNSQEVSTEQPEHLESAEETAWKAYEELKKQGGLGEESEEKEEADSEPAPDAEVKETKETKPPPVDTQKQIAEQDPELAAPERLSESEKRLFSQLPKKARRVFHRLVKDMEGRTHRGLQSERAELTKYTQRYRDLDAVVEPHRKRLAAINHNDISAVAELLDIHAKLSDPKTRQAEYRRLGQQLQLVSDTPSSDTTGLESEIEANPVYQTLRQENNVLREEINSIKNQIEAPRLQAVQQTNADLNQRLIAFSQQVDSQGRLVNPNLSQDPNYFDKRIRPLVVALMSTDPDTSFEQALTEACNRVEKRNGYTHSELTKQPAPKSNINNLSMRGRSVSVAGNGFSQRRDPIDVNESAEETAWREYNRLVGG